MIIYGDKTSFANAEIGDEFCVIGYSQWSRTPNSVINYTVKKIGKRDIKCISKDGVEIIVKIQNTYNNPYAYMPNGQERIEALNKIRKENRLRSALKLIQDRHEISKIDDELLTAIESWSERIKAAEEQS